MLRLARARKLDPAVTRDGTAHTQGRDKPELDVEFCRLDPEALAAELPSYDTRRAMLAKDPLACSDGFRTLVQLALLLPPVPELLHHRRALHGRLRQQRHGLRRHLRPHRRRVRVHRVPEIRLAPRALPGPSPAENTKTSQNLTHTRPSTNRS